METLQHRTDPAAERIRTANNVIGRPNDPIAVPRLGSYDRPRDEYGIGHDGFYVDDVIYVLPDDSTFVSPDGIGRYFYDSVAEAEEQHGELPHKVVMDLYEGNMPYEEN